MLVIHQESLNFIFKLNKKDYISQTNHPEVEQIVKQLLIWADRQRYSPPLGQTENDSKGHCSLQ